MKNKRKTKPDYWTAGLSHLKKADPILKKVISKHENDNFLVTVNTPFKTLFSIILGQQISIEAANSIEKRIKSNLGSLTPTNILNTDDESLRKYGMSFRKIRYIKGIAELINSKSKFFHGVAKLNDVEAILKLTSLYGIGTWSAEMYLIFQLNRMNVLPLGDIGLINSFCNNYQVKKNKFESEILKYREIWQPYCTVATWYLWRDIDEDVVQY